MPEGWIMKSMKARRKLWEKIAKSRVDLSDSFHQILPSGFFSRDFLLQPISSVVFRDLLRMATQLVRLDHIFFISSDLYSWYWEHSHSRSTVMGDYLDLNKPLTPFGVKLIQLPSFPEQMILLASIQDVKVVSEYDPVLREARYWITEIKKSSILGYNISHSLPDPQMFTIDA